MRGPGRCGNLVKSMLNFFFEGPTPGKIVGKTPLYSSPAERTRLVGVEKN